MAILNSLPTEIGVATETSNGLMESKDKILVNKIPVIEDGVNNSIKRTEKIKSSQLDTSTDTNKIQLGNLSEEVRAAMLGNTPIRAIIDNKSLTTEHYGDNSVTSDKRTAVGSIAMIVSEEPCNFNTKGDSNVTLSIPSKYDIYAGTIVKSITNSSQILELSNDKTSIIIFDTLNGISAINEGLGENDYIIGVFDGANVIMFNGIYTIDGSYFSGEGIMNGSIISDFSLDPRKIAIQHGQILSSKNNGPYLNANFTSNFIEVIKEFDVNIADQYVKTITVNSNNVSIPENNYDKDYLYIYYDLGTGKLNALWSSNDITKTIIPIDSDKLILLGIIYKGEIAVGINSEFISVNSISIKNKSIEYIDIFSGNIIIDFKNKKITANNVKAFIDESLVALTKNDTQTIELSDDIINNIINFESPYTIGAVKNFNDDTYKLVFKKIETISSLGLNSIPITTIKKYDITNNNENITVIKKDGDIVKPYDMISMGHVLPIDNETIVAIMTTEVDKGHLYLTTTTVPGTSIVDPFNNVEYKITEKLEHRTIVENLHGLYSVLFNTETKEIEVTQISTVIDSKVYISLGSVYELNDSLAYTSYGPILEHIILNDNRPSNYAIIDSPDPDKGYDWSNNRLVLPDDIYLLANSQYTLYCQNMSMNKYIDNDYILYELGLPYSSTLTENVLSINSPLIGDFESRIVGKFKSNNNCLYKDINIHFEKPEAKELNILCVGDETVSMNMPSYIKEYLTQLGYNPTMLGTTPNTIELYGYGMKNLEQSYGEGHKGWRMTDFMCKTKHKDGTAYYIDNNPFMNEEAKFDFSYYMNTNSYENVDVVVISVGLNDITGYHISSSVEDIDNLTIYQNIEQLPNMYKEMISSIQDFNKDTKIIINPTMIKGIDDNFNRKSLLLTESLLYELKNIDNVFIAPGYLTQPLFVSANKTSTSNYKQYNDINDTKIGSSISSSDINGVGQSILSYLITSTIIAVTKETNTNL